ncbi:hypothetical protein FHS01_002013 [Longimicrobium terrae]|uniref:Uncharacterized protein n=1 Tax=Longimicrobium terrae TaxID=1639882 RepID=A0A841GWX1_9BACT|nr:hypothetical protein [Longimicrobium terrae]MBB6070393.1 hypothetical protein [Longimicrobium terrae]
MSDEPQESIAVCSWNGEVPVSGHLAVVNHGRWTCYTQTGRAVPDGRAVMLQV